ncbi:MAG: hypothetical protein IT473_08885 [Lysobacter sp.]|nr:hypothetical protein [Lysobacter sp.]
MSSFAFERNLRRRHAAARAWKVCGLAVALGVSFASMAADPPAAEPPQPTLQQIVEQQTQLRTQVAAKRGAFKDMHDGDRDRLLKQQDRLLQMLDGHQNLDELRVEQRVEVFNHLQSVNAAVTQAEDDREVCERTRLAGSHRFTSVCMSAREYREHKENARRSVRTIGKCQGDAQHSDVCNVR